MNDDYSERDEVVNLSEVASWLELSCWTALLLAPLLYFINGAAVSDDQFIFRTSLIIIAAAIGISCSLRRALRSNLFNTRRDDI